MTVTKATLDGLAKYDTPTICNVIELFDIRPRNQGYMDSRVQSCFPEMDPMVGFATTASFRSAMEPPSGDAYGSLDLQLEIMENIPGPAVIVFQDLDDPPVAAVFGEVMCSIYQGFGAAGLITSGAGRDLLQVKDIGFPVFTGSTICSHGYCHFLHIGIPVRIGGLTVNTGELLHGDANGVTNVPIDIAADILDACEEFIAAEKIIIDYARRDGDKTRAGLAAVQKEFGSAIEKLKQRIR